jgi:hypothetical protein
VHEAEVEQTVDAAEQVVDRHMLIEPEAVEQRALCYLPTHHVRDPCRLAGVNHALVTVASSRFSTASTGYDAR